MDAFEAYKTYVSLKNHFTSEKYDYFLYGKKSKTSFDTFLKRSDKIFFAKLGNRKDAYLEDFLVSNFIRSSKMWIGEMLSDECETRYTQWKRKLESLSYVFSNEIDFISELTKDEFENLFVVSDGQHSEILLKYLRGEISLETLIILDSLLKFLRRYDKILHDPLYKEVSFLCKKYRPFLRFDLAKMRLVVKDKLNLE